MKDWYVRERCLCTGDGKPLHGAPMSYTVFDDNDHEICDVRDLETALLIAAAPNLLHYLRKVLAGEEKEEAEQYMQTIPERHI